VLHHQGDQLRVNLAMIHLEYGIHSSIRHVEPVTHSYTVTCPYLLIIANITRVNNFYSYKIKLLECKTERQAAGQVDVPTMLLLTSTSPGITATTHDSNLYAVLFLVKSLL